MSFPELSPIEEHVVLHVAAGESEQAIALDLGLSPRTVAWHLGRARQKLERAAALRDHIRRIDEGGER